MSEAFAADLLRSFVSRIEKLDKDIDDLNHDKREIYREAKGMGFDLKPLRRLIQLRRMGLEDRQEFEAVLEMYKAAMGMSGTFVATRAGTDFDPATGEIEDYKPATPVTLAKGVTSTADVCGGTPVMAGTRVATRAMRQYVEDGYSVEHIRGQYPHLTEEQILDALAYEGIAPIFEATSASPEAQPGPQDTLPPQQHRALGGAPLSRQPSLSDEDRKAILEGIPAQFLRSA